MQTAEPPRAEQPVPAPRPILVINDAREFLDKSQALLEFQLPRAEREGKAYLTVAVGCTGGRHRSVAVVQELAKRLPKRHPC